MADPILYEKARNTAWITFNRPEVKNAISLEMISRLREIFEELHGDRDTHVVVLQGRGADFSSGGDMKDINKILDGTPQQRVHNSEKATRNGETMLLAFHALPQPVIASIRGYAIGAGMLFAMAADLSIASETARFTLPNVRLGHTPDHGESYYLPRKVGLGRAMQLALLGDLITGADAERYGMVNWVVPDADLEARTAEIVDKLATSAAFATTRVKSLFRSSFEHDVLTQYEAERAATMACSGTQDFEEALRAFTEKRKPRFVGR